jgi:hypothetical protein
LLSLGCSVVAAAAVVTGVVDGAAAGLDSFAVDAWGAVGGVLAGEGALATLVVDVFEVEGVDVAGDVAVGC